MPFQIVRNDITKMHVDAIVNTANSMPGYGAGIDSAVYEAAGKDKLLAKRHEIGAIDRGTSVITDGYQLPAKYIIHTVGPRYYSDPNPAKTLENCYLNCLKLADELELHSIAFPSISTGVFGYPVEEAAKICAKVVCEYRPKHLKYAYMCIFPDDQYSQDQYNNSFLSVLQK